MTPLEQARRVFAADHYATTQSGISIEAVADKEAVCLMPVDERHTNARGMAMGGALFTLADLSAAIAANTDHLATGDLHWVSLDATIHYLAPVALGATLRATCSPIKAGHSTALFQTKIECPDNGRTVAVVETTMIRV